MKIANRQNAEESFLADILFLIRVHSRKFVAEAVCFSSAFALSQCPSFNLEWAQANIALWSSFNLCETDVP
jgi:hypothetical protein